VLLQAPAHAQVNTQWSRSRRLPPTRGVARARRQHVAGPLRTGDLNKDVARCGAVRQAAGLGDGQVPAFLLMNEHGVLQDRTLQYRGL